MTNGRITVEVCLINGQYSAVIMTVDNANRDSGISRVKETTVVGANDEIHQRTVQIKQNIFGKSFEFTTDIYTSEEEKRDVEAVLLQPSSGRTDLTRESIDFLREMLHDATEEGNIVSYVIKKLFVASDFDTSIPVRKSKLLRQAIELVAADATSQRNVKKTFDKVQTTELLANVALELGFMAKYFEQLKVMFNHAIWSDDKLDGSDGLGFSKIKTETGWVVDVRTVVSNSENRAVIELKNESASSEFSHIRMEIHYDKFGIEQSRSIRAVNNKERRIVELGKIAGDLQVYKARITTTKDSTKPIRVAPTAQEQKLIEDFNHLVGFGVIGEIL